MHDAGARQPHVHRDAPCNCMGRHRITMAWAPQHRRGHCSSHAVWWDVVSLWSWRRPPVQRDAVARGMCRRAMAHRMPRRAGWASGRFLWSRNGQVGIIHHALQPTSVAPPLCVCWAHRANHHVWCLCGKRAQCCEPWHRLSFFGRAGNSWLEHLSGGTGNSLAVSVAFSIALQGATAVAPPFAGFPRFLCVSAAWLNGLPDILRKKTARNPFLLVLQIINRMFQICPFFAHGKLYGHLTDVETHWFYIQQLGKTMDVILCLTKYMLGSVHPLC